ncbi:avidin-like [Aphelocoma coerulescens]|uniref:avidin-like n=1 Tax=Aphelocoma coerulescens TaxID=39617 RepID=UPI0036052B34
MVQATPFLLVLFLALGAHSCSTKNCILTGHWVNDLGSNMIITNMNAKGDFTGIYCTAVSATLKKTEESPLQGFQHLPNMLSQSTFGFTIHWSFSESVTVFTGQCFVDDDGKEVLKTMWLLRPHTDKLRNNRNATL